MDRSGGDISLAVRVLQKLQDILTVVTGIEQRVADIEMHLQTRVTRPEVVQFTSSEFYLGALAADLSLDQRSLLHRCPVIKNDDDWDELDAMLSDSGPHGALFKALLLSFKDRLVDRSDVHKTTNATLRALVSESYLAERVTMAGYKKGKKLILHFIKHIH